MYNRLRSGMRDVKKSRIGEGRGMNVIRENCD